MQNFLVGRPFRRPFLRLLSAGACLALGLSAVSVQAQTLSPLMYFNGSTPQGGLVIGSNGNLYGTGSESQFSTSSLGLYYALDANAGGVVTLYEYGRLGIFTGARPRAGLLLGSDGNFYGTTTVVSVDTLRNMQSGAGTVFRMSQDGQSYTKLFEFPDMTRDNRNFLINATGAIPAAALIEGLEGTVRYLYGVTFQGGTNGTGTVFKIRADGTGFMVLHHFGVIREMDQEVPGQPGQFVKVPVLNPDNRPINDDGMNPDRRLLRIGDTLWGITTGGGPNGTGVIFRVSINEPFDLASDVFPFAASPPTIATAPATPDPGDPNFGFNRRKLNTTGAYPLAALTLASDGLMYGTTSAQGGYVGDGITPPPYAPDNGETGFGTIFRIDPAAATPTIEPRLSFTGGVGANPGLVASGDLISSQDGTLIGTVQGGGIKDATTTPVTTGAGAIFKFNPVTSAYSTLYVFGADNTNAFQFGATPGTGVIEASDGTLYGIASQGGQAGGGAVFRFGTPATNGPQGIPPPFDDGSSGAVDSWMVGALTLLALMFAHQRRRKPGVSGSSIRSKDLF